MSQTIDCPYCSHEHDDGGVYEDKEDFQCHKCDKYFDVGVEFYPYYTTSNKKQIAE